MERRLLQPSRIGKEVIGVEFVIAEKLKYRSMKIVASRFDSGANNRPGRMPEFRGEVIRLDLELLQSVHRGCVEYAVPAYRTVVASRVIRYAVEDDLVS